MSTDYVRLSVSNEVGQIINVVLWTLVSPITITECMVLCVLFSSLRWHCAMTEAVRMVNAVRWRSFKSLPYKRERWTLCTNLTVVNSSNPKRRPEKIIFHKIYILHTKSKRAAQRKQEMICSPPYSSSSSKVDRL